MKTRRQTESGLTFIELLVVIVILGILAALAWPAYASMTRRARYAEVKQQMGAMAKDARIYQVEFGQYPPDRNPNQRPKGIDNWPEEVPMGGIYDYDHWAVGNNQCVVQIGFVGESLTRNYSLFAVNAQPGQFEEFDDNLVIGVDLYECSGNKKVAIK